MNLTGQLGKNGIVIQKDETILHIGRRKDIGILYFLRYALLVMLIVILVECAFLVGFVLCVEVFCAYELRLGTDITLQYGIIVIQRAFPNIVLLLLYGDICACVGFIIGYLIGRTHIDYLITSERVILKQPWICFWKKRWVYFEYKEISLLTGKRMIMSFGRDLGSIYFYVDKKYSIGYVNDFKNIYTYMVQKWLNEKENLKKSVY